MADPPQYPDPKYDGSAPDENASRAVALGYLIAVLVATGVIHIELWGYGLLNHPDSDDLRLLSAFALAAVFSISFFFFALFCTLIPFSITVLLAKWFAIRSVWYYVIAGALTAVLMSPLNYFLVLPPV
jgi:hypothetical protein